MPTIGEAPPAGYSPIPQNVAISGRAANIVVIKDRGLEDVLASLARATGNPDAQLRTVQDAHGLRILVPSSPSGVPSGWTRFKAALSNLPLLSRSATLRAARFEVESKPLDSQGLDELVSVVEREEKKIESDLRIVLNGHYTSQARGELERRPLSQRNVQEMLRCTLSTMSTYAAGERVQRARAEARGAEPPAPRDPPPLTGRKEPLTEAQKFALDGTQVFLASKDVAIAPRSSSAPDRHKGLLNLCTTAVRDKVGSADPREIDSEVQKLYDRARGTLTKHGKWPISNLQDAVFAVSYVK
jgi:hypothetical protein